MAKRRELWGLWYDPTDKLVYPSEDSVNPLSDFTFENLRFNSSLEDHFPHLKSRFLAFFYAPTEDTAKRVFSILQGFTSGHANFRLQKEPIKESLTGTWSHPEWSIYAMRTNLDADFPETDAFSVGLLAKALMSHGTSKNSWAVRSFVAELQNQGAWLG